MPGRKKLIFGTQNCIYYLCLVVALQKIIVAHSKFWLVCAHSKRNLFSYHISSLVLLLVLLGIEWEWGMRYLGQFIVVLLNHSWCINYVCMCECELLVIKTYSLNTEELSTPFMGVTEHDYFCYLDPAW